ncbi:MAG: FkbM family methyltransferase [Actinomycetota bacterium]|nr:FkbM family methyltransferase [Actinomycetota bacterium]
MSGRLLPRARSYAYRAFTRLPHERMDAWRARPSGRASVAALQRVLGNGPVEIGGGLLSGQRLDTRALTLTHVQAFGLVRGALEPGVQEALRRHVAPGASVYDIGANIGFFSLLAARLAGPTGSVEAFEPLPAAAAGLRRHVALNDARTVTVHELAVAAHSGRAQLMAVQEASWSHLAQRGRHPDTQEVLEVQVVTIDELVAGGMRAPNVVKIDVEGAEIDVLEGMAETIRAHSPAIICELHGSNAEFVAYADAIGYVAHNLDGPPPLADAGAVHALALPAGAARAA